MPEGQTPSSYLYEELRRFAGLSNREAARILLSDRPIFGGRSPRDRVEERTFLSREVVHQQPSNANPMLYGDFSQSAQTIVHRMAQRIGTRDAHQQITLRYSDEPARTMAALLDAYGRDGRIYLNTVMRVRSAQLTREGDRAVLLVMAFLAAGATSDPRTAANLVDQFTRRSLATALVTLETSVGQGAAQPATPAATSGLLGIVRVVNDAVKPPIYALSADPQGTVVGSIPTEGSCITDVEVDVSRRHLIIWRQQGHWWCQGLGSTNGTVLISGATKELVTVEAPRSMRRGKDQPTPVELQAGDTLCLGISTRFLVMQMQG